MGVGLREKYLLPCCCFRDFLYFDKQHDHVLKKLNFDIVTQRVLVCGQNICYHVAAAFVILFNLIRKMTMF